MNPINIAVIQFAPLWGKKDENLSRIESLVNGIQADIIVLPELCTTGYFFCTRKETRHMAEPAEGRTVSFFRDISNKKKAVVVAGFAERDGDALYISCVIVVPEVSDPYIYRKTHLFYKERQCFDPGNTGFFVIDDAERDLRIGPMICYDWRFPESARILTLLGADLIVCPANLVTEAWKMVMPARAVENKVYVAVANRSGVERREDEELIFKGASVVYDYLGNELARAGDAGEAVLQTTIYPRQTRDKSFNSVNDVLADRRPQWYGPLVEYELNIFSREKTMTLEEAIKTAIEYETQARNVYRDAVRETPDPVGKRIFQALADDEQHHVDYLTEKLREWKEMGKITVEKLKSTIPSREQIAREAGKLKEKALDKDRGDEKQMLGKALKMEIDASSFYGKLVDDMPEEIKPLFAEFLEIEERHVAAVQAQLDYISGTGYWFDFKEFDME